MAEQGPRIEDGKLIDPKVELKIYNKIEKGALAAVHALVVHQTGGSTAQSSLSSYDSGKAGAHFLIDRDGKIYQTARTSQQCWHVGNIQSRCYALKSCSADELKNIKAILFKKGDSYATRIKALNKHEGAKAYPDRYPNNSDSLGIELVAAYSEATGYDPASTEQNTSLAWLVTTLESLLSLTGDDVYRHPQVSYKQATEAQSAAW